MNNKELVKARKMLSDVYCAYVNREHVACIKASNFIIAINIIDSLIKENEINSTTEEAK